MSRIKALIEKVNLALRSPRGRDAMMFFVFIIISTILWMVLSLNGDKQYDVRMPVRITHIPDSVTLISKGPDALGVSLTSKGTQVIKMALGNTPTVNVDFRAFRSGNALHLTSTDLKGLVRNASGGSQVSVVYPDTLSIPFTTHEGFKLPIVADYKVSAGPQSTITSRPRLSADSARVYMAANELPESFNSITTEPIRLLGIDETVHRRVKLLGPVGSRIIPDSIDIIFEVERLIFKNRKVVIEPINVPKGIKLITFPAQTEVHYMVPMSLYRQSDAHFRVVADYHTISPSGKVKLTITNVPDQFHNVSLATDSAEYIIERH